MVDVQKPATTLTRRTGSPRALPGILALGLSLVLALACDPLRKANAAYDQQQYDDALAEYSKALQKDPNDVHAKIGYRRTAPLAAEQHLAKANVARKHGNLELETTEVAKAAVLDPANAEAQDRLNRLAVEAERARAQEEASESVEAARKKGEAREGLPINPRSLEGLDLNFNRKTSLREILQQLSRNSGVNILLHASVTAQDVSLTIDLRGLTFQQVLDALMLQCDMFYRVLDPNTIMVFRKTPQNSLEFENKLIQTFYLSNAEADNVRQIFSALLPQMRVFTDKRLNSLTVLAKSSDLNIARRVVKQVDKAKAEVMIYLELLEVSKTVAINLGLLPTLTADGDQGTYSIGATTTSRNELNQNSLTGSLSLARNSIQYLFPGIRLDMAKTSGQTKLLADPNVRVVSGETGEVNIGEKLSTTQSSLGPASTPTASAGAAGAAVSAALATQTTYGYEDVGVNIKVKPRVHFNGDITIELDSKVTTEAPGGSPGRPNINQRVIKTTARLRNGETAIFGGMLKETERKFLQGLWGVSNVPVLGDLLGHHNDDDRTTDVILSIRAVIVRTADLQDDDFGPYDPDQAPNPSKPFLPKPEQAPAPAPGAAEPAAPAAAEPAAPAAAEPAAEASSEAPAAGQAIPPVPDQQNALPTPAMPEEDFPEEEPN